MWSAYFPLVCPSCWHPGSRQGLCSGPLSPLQGLDTISPLEVLRLLLSTSEAQLRYYSHHRHPWPAFYLTPTYLPAPAVLYWGFFYRPGAWLEASPWLY